MSDRELLVYVDLAGVAHLVGRLWARRARNRESATFEYDADWLASPARFALEPALMLGGGPQHTQQGRALYGDDSDLRLILAPGSSLGAARAKASVLDQQGELSIAKFPQADDA